jgi:hypothetical protein
MPVLHFSGKFRSYPPLYNNSPLQPEKYFDEKLSPLDVKKRVTEGVEPLQYFEFEFYNTYIKKITYDDGSSVSSAKEDPIIGKEVKLKGLLVDTSPHLIRGRLFAGEFRVLDFILARLNLAVQSDLFRTVRGSGTGGIRSISADFESSLYQIDALKNEFVTEENDQLKIYYNVNSFDFSTLEGKVYGYLGPSVPTENKQEVRIQERRLLLDHSISTILKRDFNIKDSDLEPVDNIQRKDLEGSYEILEDKKFVILRYLNFIPFINYNHVPPHGYTFSVVMLENGKQIDIPYRINIEVNDENKISRDGGTCIFRIPENIVELDKFSIAVIATKNKTANNEIFMTEPVYDLILKDNQKFLTLSSGKDDEKVVVRIYKKINLQEVQMFN